MDQDWWWPRWADCSAHVRSRWTWAFGAVAIGLGVVLLRRRWMSVRTLYRLVAAAYDDVVTSHRDWGYRDAYRALEAELRGLLPEGGYVLDLGCGTGVNLERLLALGLPYGAYVGVDVSEAMLSQARTKFAHAPRVRFKQLDVTRDPLPEEQFDLITSTWVFEHFYDPVAVVDNAWKSLRPGGYMLLLFEVEDRSGRGRLLRWLWGRFHAWPVARRDYERFWGLETACLFRGALLPVAVVRLHKPSSERDVGLRRPR